MSEKITITLEEHEWKTIIKALHLQAMFSLNGVPLVEGENPFAIMDYISDELKPKSSNQEKDDR